MKKNTQQARCSQVNITSHTYFYTIDGFIETVDDMEGDSGRRHHAALDSRRQVDGDDQTPEQIARDLRRRYGGRAAVRYTGDMNEIPQRLLMPSVHDASLWQVRVRVSYSLVSMFL